jgi:hypothetical protein
VKEVALYVLNKNALIGSHFLELGGAIHPFYYKYECDPHLEAVMNYLKIYCNLIRKAEQRGYTKRKSKEQGLYVEGHHIFPVSIFGKNKRVVYLTAREHYIAHALLEKGFIKRYKINHWKTKKMTNAHIIMGGRGKYKNSYLYEEARKRYSKNKSGIPMKESVRIKIRNYRVGKIHSIETREKIKNKNTGKKQSKEHTEKMVNSKLLYTYTFVSPDGKIFEVINATQFCRDKKISRYRMSQVWLGRNPSHSGWKATRILRDK